MAAKTRQQSAKSSKDIFFWSLMVILVCGALGADYYFRNIAWSLRLAGWIVLGCILLVILMQTVAGKKFWKFAQDARVEMRKVVWPNRQETIRTTAVVTGLVLLTALILWGADSILLWVIGWITGQRG